MKQKETSTLCVAAESESMIYRENEREGNERENARDEETRSKENPNFDWASNSDMLDPSHTVFFLCDVQSRFSACYDLFPVPAHSDDKGTPSMALTSSSRPATRCSR